MTDKEQKGKGVPAAWQQNLEGEAGLVENRISTPLSEQLHETLLTFQLDAPIRILFRGPSISFFIFIVRVQLVPVYVIAFWVAAKDVPLVTCMLDRL